MTPLERFQALSPRERNLLGGAVLMTVLVLARYASLPSGDEFDAGPADAPWVQVAKIENYRRVLSHSAAVEEQTAEIAKRLEAQQSRLTGGATATQVAAELQGAVSAMASTAGLNVLSSQILKEEEVDGFKRVGVRLTLSGDLEGIAKLVASIEGGDKDLVVSHLEINRKLGSQRRPTTSTSKAAPAADTSQPALTVSIEVKSFLRQGA